MEISVSGIHRSMIVGRIKAAVVREDETGIVASPLSISSSDGNGAIASNKDLRHKPVTRSKLSHKIVVAMKRCHVARRMAKRDVMDAPSLSFSSDVTRYVQDSRIGAQAIVVSVDATTFGK